MKKLLFLTGISLCLSAPFAQAQTFTAAGTIISPANATIGYMKPDGAVEDTHHTVIGYIRKDGTIENSHHATIGYVKDDGTLEDSHHATLGHAGASKTDAVLKQFFFKS